MTTPSETSSHAEVAVQHGSTRGRVSGSSNTVITITAIIGLIMLAIGVLWFADRAISHPVRPVEPTEMTPSPRP